MAASEREDGEIKGGVDEHRKKKLLYPQLYGTSHDQIKESRKVGTTSNCRAKARDAASLSSGDRPFNPLQIRDHV